MNTKRSLISLLVLSSVSLAPAMAVADPTSTSLTISCPSTQLSANMITNFGSYIGGFGVESLLSQTMNVYFISQSVPYNTPATLANYFNETVSYNSTTGIISCSYQSNVPTDPFFSVAYQLTNGRGGYVTSQSSNALSLNFPLGLKG